MKQNNLANLTNEELLEKHKKLKSSKKLNSFLIGMCFGIAGYSTIKNGFGVLRFFR